MRRLLRYVLLLLALLPLLPAQALTHLNVRDGLSGGSVYALLQDRYGLMWFATSGGVSCYNGLSFRSYVADGLRSRNLASDLAQTSDGMLYVATEHGIYTPDIQHPGMLRAVAAELKECVNTLVAIDNTLYAGTETGLYMVEGERISKHLWPTADHLSKRANNVADLLADGQALWVLTSDELYRLDAAKGRLVAQGLRGQLPAGGTLRTMAKSGQRVFVGTFNDGLFSYDIQQRKASRYTDVGSNVITHLQVVGKRLYVATDGAGVSVVSIADGKVRQTYTTQNGLLDNTVYAFLQTPHGNNWFGYFRRGVSHADTVRPLFRCFERPGFSTRGLNVRSFCIDGESVVVGTREGLYHYDGHTAHYYSPRQLDGGSIITSVVKYDGAYYFSTFDHGVYRLNAASGSVSRFGSDPLLRTASFSRLCVAPDGRLWMAGNAGIFVYDGRTDQLTHYDARNSQLHDGYVNSLLFDRQGRCWIGTHQGICIYNPSDGMVRAGGFPEGFHDSVAEPNFLLGVGGDIVSYSADGLYRTNESLTRFGVLAGNAVLDGSLISIVACDHQKDQYWVGTEQGLFCFDSTLAHYRKYGRAFGMASTEFSTGACLIDSARRLWVATMDGLYFAPLADVAKASLPRATILLANVTIGGHDIEGEEEMDMLRHHQLSLRFLWGTDELRFQPTLLNYADQRDIYFEYRIGSSGEWHTICSGEAATISGLSLGRQTLSVRVAGTDIMTTYAVSVWPSGWWLLQVVVIVALVAVLVVYRRNRKELVRVKENLAEEKAKYKRVRTSDSESEELFARLKDYVEKHHCYLEPDLKMSELATALDCSPVKLSQLLNIYAGQNYYDFINAYRLEEFKRRLSDPQYEQYTLVALSEMCGFKKSAFFSTFKKMEGMTPSEYLKRVKRDF